MYEAGSGWARHFKKKVRVGIELSVCFLLGAFFYGLMKGWEEVKEEIVIWIAFALLPVVAWLVLVLMWNVWLAPLRFLRNAESRSEGLAAIVQFQGKRWKRNQEWARAARWLLYQKGLLTTYLEWLDTLDRSGESTETFASLVIDNNNNIVTMLGFLCPDAVGMFGNVEDVEVLSPILQSREIRGRITAAIESCDAIVAIASEKLALDTQGSQQPEADSSHP